MSKASSADCLGELSEPGGNLGHKVGASYPPRKPVRNGRGIMPRSIQCTNCGVVLNLPAQAEGRKLQCPKCGIKFRAGGTGAAPGTGKPSAGSNENAESTVELSKKQSSVELPVMPLAAGDLRETFDLPMMTEAASSGHGGMKSGTSGGKSAADALALFDDKPAAPRRKTGAEARAQARRCPTCGGVVPQGMSICQTCGLDLESGMRVGLDDDLSPPPTVRSQGIPLPIGIVGGVCFAASLSLAVAALVMWMGGMEGAFYFVPVALFGGFAAVQFLRGKSVKLLLAALTLGAMIDLAGLVALPIYVAHTETQVIAQRPGEVDDPNESDVAITPITERLDTNKIKLGITLLILYGVISIYLISPQVSRHFKK